MATKHIRHGPRSTDQALSAYSFVGCRLVADRWISAGWWGAVGAVLVDADLS
jgi:hypothetical protein